MAETVVHRFQVVQVNEKYRPAGLSAAGFFHFCLQLVVQISPVGQTGQRVMKRLVSGALVGQGVFDGNRRNGGKLFEYGQLLRIHGDRFAEQGQADSADRLAVYE